MEENTGLLAERLDKGAVPGAEGASAPAVNHAAYRFEFSSGLFMSFFIWAADEEFPPSAQILFDDNFPSAFSAEDLAAAGAVALDHLKEMRARIS
jgi:hypothetical protein